MGIRRDSNLLNSALSNSSAPNNDILDIVQYRNTVEHIGVTKSPDQRSCAAGVYSKEERPAENLF
jgi:hypothetical protein